MDKIKGLPLIDRLEIAFNVLPSRLDNHIVFTTENFRGIEFGFRDAITLTDDLCYPAILKFNTSNQLAEIFEQTITNQRRTTMKRLLKK